MRFWSFEDDDLERLRVALAHPRVYRLRVSIEGDQLKYKVNEGMWTLPFKPDPDPLHPRVTTWADGFGVWHVRVPKDSASPVVAARRALRAELLEREEHVAGWVWMQAVRVPEQDTEDGIVFREATSHDRERTDEEGQR
jgi:hypothetical protein